MGCPKENPVEVVFKPPLAAPRRPPDCCCWPNGVPKPVGAVLVVAGCPNPPVPKLLPRVGFCPPKSDVVDVDEGCDKENPVLVPIPNAGFCSPNRL